MLRAFGSQKYCLPKLVLKTQRLWLRPPQIPDMDKWLKVRGKNAQRLKALEPRWPKDGLSPKYYKRRLARQVHDWQSDNGYPFLIFRQDTGELTGGININHVCRGAAQYASLGYWLCQSNEGYGYMSEALGEIQNFAFGTLRLHRLQAATLPENERSIRLLTCNGFEKEGFARKYIKINGYWRDHILFGLPVEDWKVKESASDEDFRKKLV